MMAEDLCRFILHLILKRGFLFSGVQMYLPGLIALGSGQMRVWRGRKYNSNKGYSIREVL
jgi:hypothetical protein